MGVDKPNRHIAMRAAFVPVCASGMGAKSEKDGAYLSVRSCMCRAVLGNARNWGGEKKGILQTCRRSFMIVW